MPTILPFDDLEAGRFVTVHSRRADFRPRMRRPSAPFEGDEQEVHIHLGGSGGGRIPNPGVPLKILALNAPFLMVLELHPGGVGKGPIYLDSRRVRLMAVPDAMIDALRGLQPSRPEAVTSTVPACEIEGLDDESDLDEELPF